MYDIFVATRPNLSASFNTIEPVAELNSPSHDFLRWLSVDGCRLYLSRGPSIWVASKPTR